MISGTLHGIKARFSLSPLLLEAGIDLTALAAQLQSDGAKGFVACWQELLEAIDAKSKVLA